MRREFVQWMNAGDIVQDWEQLPLVTWITSNRARQARRPGVQARDVVVVLALAKANEQ